jgi:hypothetical protein
MYYRQMSPRLDPAVNINYYSNNKFGIDLVKAQINTTYSLLIVVVFTNKKIIHSQIVRLLNGMYTRFFFELNIW